jgi:carbonic anhydrase
LLGAPQPVNAREVFHLVAGAQDFFAYMGSLTTPDCNEQACLHGN